MPSASPKRPAGPTLLPTSTAVLTTHTVEPPLPLFGDEIDQDGGSKSRRGTPSPNSAARTSPANAALSSALRPAADSLSARGGAMHNAQAWPTTTPPGALGLTNLVALDLEIPPAPAQDPRDPSPSDGPRVNGGTNAHPTSKASRQRAEIDQGYEGETQTGTEGDLLTVPSGYGPRDYLTGPSDELVLRLPRPSPLSPHISALPSPAISSTSVSTPGIALPDQSVEEDLFRKVLARRQNGHGATTPPAGDEELYCDDEAQTLLAEDSTPSRPRPRAFTLSHSAFGSFGTFPSTARSGPLAPPTLRSRFKLFWLQLFANAASAAFLVLIVIWALTARFFQGAYRVARGLSVPRHRREWDTDEARAYRKTEKVVKDIQYYARRCGFDIIEQTVETKDGYLLKVFKVECLKKPAQVHSDGRKGFPVLIQHGLFQSCGSL